MARCHHFSNNSYNPITQSNFYILPRMQGYLRSLMSPKVKSKPALLVTNLLFCGKIFQCCLSGQPRISLFAVSLKIFLCDKIYN